MGTFIKLVEETNDSLETVLNIEEEVQPQEDEKTEVDESSEEETSEEEPVEEPVEESTEETLDESAKPIFEYFGSNDMRKIGQTDAFKQWVVEVENSKKGEKVLGYRVWAGKGTIALILGKGPKLTSMTEYEVRNGEMIGVSDAMLFPA